MSEIDNSLVTPRGLVTLPDGVNVPIRFWLLMLHFGGTLRQVRPFFDEQQINDVVKEAHEISLATGFPDPGFVVLGPYTLRNDV
jgi:hypothetical protein